MPTHCFSSTDTNKFFTLDAVLLSYKLPVRFWHSIPIRHIPLRFHMQIILFSKLRYLLHHGRSMVSVKGILGLPNSQLIIPFPEPPLGRNSHILYSFPPYGLRLQSRCFPSLPQTFLHSHMSLCNKYSQLYSTLFPPICEFIRHCPAAVRHGLSIGIP